MADYPEWYKRLPAQALSSLVEGLGVPGSFFNANQISDIFENHSKQLGLNSPLPNRPVTVENIRQNVTEPVFGQELLQPRNPLERGIQSFGHALPVAIATGGASIPATIGRTAAGTLLQQGAQELGLPAPIQFFAGIAGEKGFDKIFNRAIKQGIPKQTLATLADDAKKQFYAKEQELGSKIKIDAKPFKEELSRLEKQAAKDTRLTTADRKELLSDIDQYRSDFKPEVNWNKKGNYNVADANFKTTASQLAERRKELNYNIGKSEGRAKNYYQALAKSARSTIDEAGKQHEQWYKALKSGDAIHDAQNFRQTFIEGLTDYPKIQKVLTNPLAYGVATFGPSFFWTRDPLISLAYAGGVTTGAYAIGKPIAKGLDLWGFMRHPQNRNLLFEASEQMLNRNYPAALNSYSRLNKNADKYEKQQQRNKVKTQTKSTNRLMPLNTQNNPNTSRNVEKQNMSNSRLVPLRK